jgi:hypothetical protein
LPGIRACCSWRGPGIFRQPGFAIRFLQG